MKALRLIVPCALALLLAIAQSSSAQSAPRTWSFHSAKGAETTVRLASGTLDVRRSYRATHHWVDESITLDNISCLQMRKETDKEIFRFNIVTDGAGKIHVRSSSNRPPSGLNRIELDIEGKDIDTVGKGIFNALIAAEPRLGSTFDAGICALK